MSFSVPLGQAEEKDGEDLLGVKGEFPKLYSAEFESPTVSSSF